MAIEKCLHSFHIVLLIYIHILLDNNMEYKRRKLRVSYPEKKGGEIRDMKGPINI